MFPFAFHFPVCGLFAAFPVRPFRCIHPPLSRGIGLFSGTCAIQTSVNGLQSTAKNFTATLGGLAGTGNLALGSGSLTVGGNGNTTTYAGSLSGGGALIKIAKKIFGFRPVRTIEF